MALSDFLALNNVFCDASGQYVLTGASDGNIAPVPYGSGFTPSYSRYSEEILFASTDGHRIWALHRNTYALRLVRYDANHLFFYPQQCNGTVVFMQTDLAGANPQIWACNWDGSGAWFVNYGTQPCLSLDGATIVFTGWTGSSWQIACQALANNWAYFITTNVISRYWTPQEGPPHGYWTDVTDPDMPECFSPALSPTGNLAFIRGKMTGATADPSTWGKRNLAVALDGMNAGNMVTFFPACATGNYTAAGCPAFGLDGSTYTYIRWASSQPTDLQIAHDPGGAEQSFRANVAPGYLSPNRIAGNPTN